MLSRLSKAAWSVRTGIQNRLYVLSKVHGNAEQEHHGKAKIKLESSEHKLFKKEIDDEDDTSSHKKEYPKTHAVSHATHKKELEKNQERAVAVTKMGAAANILLAISKGAVGLSISSTALVADAANSLCDVMSDAVVYYTLLEARKTATPDRPWGRGKIEPLGALSVGALLLATGVGIGFSACHAAYEMLVPLSHIPMIVNPAGIAAGIEAALPAVATAEVLIVEERSNIENFAALGISGTSILAKELLFRFTLNAGQKANSSAVIANAWQHRADVSTSIAVFAGLVGSMMGYPILDPVAGILVAGVIMKQAYIIAMDSLRDLSDAPASDGETDNLRRSCLSVMGVLQVEELKARKSGPFLFVEVTVGVGGSISASAAHRLAEITRLALLSKHYGRVANAVVHVTPIGSSGLGEKYPSWARDHGFIEQEIHKAVKKIKEIQSVSEVQVYYKDDGLISTKVDILLPSNLTIHQAHVIAVQARKSIEEALPGIGSVDVDLELDET
jgi:cation diffusion facilitator family transporter